MRFAEAAESKRTTDYVAAHVAPAGRVRLWCPGIHHRGSESLTIWLPGGEIRNDSAGKKGGHHLGPPFFIADQGAWRPSAFFSRDVASRHAARQADILAVTRHFATFCTDVLARPLLVTKWRR